MRTTRACDYAVRLLTVLANARGRRLRVTELATATSVPQGYALKVLIPLVRRGWVESYRGADGGFSLLDPAQKITLLDIVELFEGPIHLQVCTAPTGCDFSPRCPAHPAWLEAETELCRVLAKYKIEELAARSRQRGLFLPPE